MSMMRVVCFGGILGFVLFFLYDINSVVWKKKALYGSFAAGCICVAVSTCLLAWKSLLKGGLVYGGILLLAAAFLFFCLLVYTLFFALPFHDTYQEFKEKSGVCDTGVYGLCRHPGVLWFFFFYLFAGLALENRWLLAGGMIFSFCNLCYVLFQDHWSFPKQFENYDEYKQQVPFLVPNRSSIKKCLGGKKDERGGTAR